MEFCDDMPGLYAACDIALTRGGANALAELIALEIPSVVVPPEKASRELIGRFICGMSPNDWDK